MLSRKPVATIPTNRHIRLLLLPALLFLLTTLAFADIWSVSTCATSPDMQQACAVAGTALKDSIGARSPKLILVFDTFAAADRQKMLDSLGAQFDKKLLFGCGAHDAAISTDTGGATLSLLAVGGDFTLISASADVKNDQWTTVGKQLGNSLKVAFIKDVRAHGRLLLLFTPSTSSQLTQGIQQVLGKDAPIMGSATSGSIYARGKAGGATNAILLTGDFTYGIGLAVSDPAPGKTLQQGQDPAGVLQTAGDVAALAAGDNPEDVVALLVCSAINRRAFALKIGPEAELTALKSIAPVPVAGLYGEAAIGQPEGDISTIGEYAISCCAIRTTKPHVKPALTVPRVTADWPQWRGPNRDSISPESGLALNWDTTPPKPLWQANVGIGYSSMSVAAGKLYTAGWNWHTGQDTISCLNAVTGKVIWKYAYIAGSGVWFDVGRGHVPEFLGPRATPTVEGDRVYTLGADGQAFCFDANNGKVIWKRNLVADKDAHLHVEWCLAGSPLIVANKVILASKGGSIAVDKLTGKTLWTVGGEVAGLCSPQIFQYQAKPCLLLHSSSMTYVVDAETGDKLWQYAWGSSYDSADPLVIGDSVFLGGAYAKQSLLVPIGSKKPTWQGANIIPEVASPILYKGLIYSQTGYCQGAVASFDPADGKQKFATDKQNFVNHIIADGKLIATDDHGGIYTYDIQADGFKPLGHYTPPGLQAGDIDSAGEIQPILAQGRLYVRNWHGELVALDVTGDSTILPHRLKPPLSKRGPRMAEWASPLDKTPPPAFLTATPADWCQWRGPQRDGVVTETGLQLNWRDGAPPVRWRLDIGYGYSSIVGAGDRIYTMGWRQGEDMRPEFVWCLDARTGRVIWKYQYTSRESGAFLDADLGKLPLGMGPRATPLLDGDKLYAFNTTGDVFCLDAAIGSLVWTKNIERDLPEDKSVKRPSWQHAGTPIVIGDALIFNDGLAGLALDKHTGALLWSNGPAAGGQANPVLFTQNGKQRLALRGALALNILDPADGKLQWSLPWTKAIYPVVPDPLIIGDKILLTDVTGATLTPIGGDKPVWTCPAPQPKVGTPILYNGYLYCASQPGAQLPAPGTIQYGNTIPTVHSANQSDSELLCVNAADGTVKWREKLPVTQLLLAGDTLIMQGLHGDITLATATPDGYKPLGAATVLNSDQCWASPAIINGRLFCRSCEGELICIDLKGR